MTIAHPKRPCPRLLSYKALASSLLPKDSQSSPHTPNRFFFKKTFKQRTSIMSIFLWKIFCLIGGIGWEKVRRTFRRNSMARIFSIVWFITCVYYLGRVPSPIVTKKLKETSKTEEMEESEEEIIWFHFVWCGFFGENSTGERLRIWRVQGTSF